MEQESESTETKSPLDLKSSLGSVQGRTSFTSCNDNSDTKPGENKDFSFDDDAKDNSKGSSSPSRNSPEPSCAICLGPLQNKSFTDSCFHTFCFTCLLEWSKVKAECPLCKQRFKSIVHNVRSIEDYDQYYIVSRSSESSWRSPDGRRFRYSSTLTAERVLERRRRATFEDPGRQTDFQMHRLLYAPHSVSVISSITLNNERHVSSSFRRLIYEDGLWVRQPSPATKVRDTSPQFYRQNPACTHRLIPWLNRELLALLHSSETRVMFVLDLILALIMRYDIRSQEFYVHIQPYLGDKTSHFVHEFFHFASSIYDMEQYDEHISYERLESYDSSVVLSSPGSDVIFVPSGDDYSIAATAGSSSAPSTSGSTSSSSSKKSSKKKKRSKGVTKLYLKRNQENNLWNVWSLGPSTSSGAGNSQSFSSAGVRTVADVTSSLFDDVPGTSGTQGIVSVPTHSQEEVNISSDDDDCVIIDEFKPKWQRTPELIDLVNSSDDEYKASKSVEPEPSATETSTEKDENWASGLELFLKAIQMHEAVDPSASTSHCSPVPTTSSHHETEKSNKSYLEENHHSRTGRKKKKKDLRKWRDYDSSSTDIDDHVGYSSSSRSCSRDKFSLLAPSGNDLDHDHTYKRSYYSDSTDVSDYPSETQDQKVKQLKSKLRSVVTHVSGDQHHGRSDSSHHSSHNKKHKEKHKKKKKHEKHKRHKHRSHSRDEKAS